MTEWKHLDLNCKIVARIAAAFGGTTTIVDLAIQALRTRWKKAEGKAAPIYHALTRPPRAESKAVRRAIAMAEIAQVPVYIVHLSSEDALNEVREARDRGVPACDLLAINRMDAIRYFLDWRSRPPIFSVTFSWSCSFPFFPGSSCAS